MLPDNEWNEEDADNDLEDANYVDRTYKLNFDTKTIDGIVDGEDARVQAIQKILLTEGEEYDIYSNSYGLIKNDLIGEESPWVDCEAQDRIEEAILIDDRFESVEFTENIRSGDKLSISFTVTDTELNDIDMEGVELDV